MEMGKRWLFFFLEFQLTGFFRAARISALVRAKTDRFSKSVIRQILEAFTFQKQNQQDCFETLHIYIQKLREFLYFSNSI